MAEGSHARTFVLGLVQATLAQQLQVEIVTTEYLNASFDIYHFPTRRKFRIKIEEEID